MSARIGDIYFDTCTLANFAAVDRLDLLRERYGHRARWTETIRWEITRGVGAAPYLQRVLQAEWLGEPVEISDSTSALTEINNIRRGLGALGSSPTRHLGEAEIIYHLQHVDVGAFFVTDDREALNFARRRGLFTFDTHKIMEECFSCSEVGCPEAFELLQQMAASDRGVRVPSSHMGVCPS
ncbi:hypothetical protein ACTI_14940 [Actinoplanes sp. OR16]|uniref:hypothetical protein n=1 Tax=Actinoplanes sp. OR16 TaxID=946334 RepID=UPI000F6D611D|nr:hypothetical protein [Actinoplanes sp. OR16]BBH64809.1 hypothetical protein ACTI_14940 [Actinoplanes sp. OR16]